MQRLALWLLGGLVVLGLASAARAADDAEFTRQEDVIYGRKWGMALTMDVFTPKKDANGAAVVYMVSGGWFSRHEAVNGAGYQEFLKHGYTVFAVVHGSQPKFTIPEAVADMHRAVRFIRHHAKDYQIDPDRLGITGGSAGGHLSLMQATAGTKGDPNAKDPVERESSRVQAVACFFPPTDFLNYGEKGKDVITGGLLKNFRAPFDFHEFDKDKGLFLPVTDKDKVRDILRQISPVTYVTADDPPALIIHGDKDTLVPIQQAEVMIAKLKEAGVPCELVVKKGAAHGWADFFGDIATLADWFDKYLKKSPKE
jgi:acetyl esterase/lipase